MDKINKYLEVTEKSIQWVINSLDGDKQKKTRRNFVNFRRELNKKKFALEGNPAAAVYGESQVGKSYLISSLLSMPGKAFEITDRDGKSYHFIEEINPPGGGSESTSLVSRFSINDKPVNPQYPVTARLLSPADLVMALCDSFYNDIKLTNRENVLQTNDIDKEVELLKEKWHARTPLQNAICEDDILDIQDYFDNFSTKASNITNSCFFEEISLLIPKIQPSEWKGVFQLLWNNNKVFTELFADMIAEYEKLNFAKTLYLPIEAVLYKHGTLLDVNRLREIYEQPAMIETNYKADTPVLFFDDKEVIKPFLKSYLCALTAELIFNQPEALAESKGFLRESDLLDFPGARSRLTLPEDKIEKEIIPELLIRGKVAYLFNKYSDSEKVNILLFCAKHEQAAQRSMPEMLNNWINKIVGDSCEKREAFIQKSKVPPLFIIGTWFNVNLQYNPKHDKEGDNASLKNRWYQRFEKTLAKELLNTEVYDWFENWTGIKQRFKNIFLLRDFEKSDEHASKLFKGFREHKEEKEEIKPENFPDFREKLRQSFLENDFVNNHFESPEESWDQAASINKDGAELIIKKLSIAANNINAARNEKTKTELNAIARGIISELKKHYHSSESDEALQKARQTAGALQVRFDIGFGGDKIKLFGQMMKEFMVNEGDVYKLYHAKIHDIERRNIVNMDKYSNIRMNVPALVNVREIDGNSTFDNNLERLRQHYEKTSAEECRAYFEAEGIDLDELFYGDYNRIKNFSQILAESLEEHWLEKCAKKNNRIVTEILAEDELQDLLNMLKTLFGKLQISKIIAEKIRRFVDGYHNIDEAIEMIADISAEIINKFFNSFGFDYFSESDIFDLKAANEKNNLSLNLDHSDLSYERNSAKEAADMLLKIDKLHEMQDKNPQALTNLPHYRNYKIWYDLLKIGFVHVCDIPNYDVQANNKLKVIIEMC